MCRALEVVAPLSEGLEYGEQFLVVDLVVELCWLRAAGVECDQVDVAIVGGDLGDDRSNCIVRSISLNDNGVVRVEMRQDRGLCEGRFEGFKCFGVVGAPDEWGILLGKANQGDDDVGEPLNESTIKVGETQECLDCFEVSRGRPDTDRIGLGGVHRDASGGNHKAQELNLLHVEQALFGFGVQVVFAKTFQDSLDMNPILFQLFGEYEDIIEVYHYEDVSHVLEDVVHKGLERSGSIGESHRHDQEFEGAIARPEGCFPLMARCDTNIVVASLEVELGVDLCAAQLVKEVGNEWNRVSILSSDLVEVSEVNTESQGAVLLLSKEDRGTTW